MVLEIADAAHEMLEFGARITTPRAKNPIATIDQSFVDRLIEISEVAADESMLDKPMVGATQVYSPIYRVGRLDENSDMQARIRLNDKACDVRVAGGAVADAFDVAKTGNVVPISVDCIWRRNDDGVFVIDNKRTTITRIDVAWRPISGAAFLSVVHASIPDVFSDLDDVIPGDDA
jgi:hypothetical protein